jgi:phosphoribosylamine--glycine ligase
MKFLFRSSDGLCIPQALRVKSEGNQVRLSIQSPGYDKMGDGLIDKTTDFGKAVEWADVVVYDVKADGPLPAEADDVCKLKPTVGASALGGDIERDRDVGIDFARRSGVKVPDMQRFHGSAAFAKAREYLADKPRTVDWVLKINGKAPDGVGTFVSKDGRSGAIRMLKHWEEMYRAYNIRPDFIITQRIEGCEISTEGWFNGKDFSCFNHTIERTKFFPGDLGEKVGCCGNVVWATDRESPLCQKLLVPLISELAGKLVGPLDVNVIIEKSSNEPVFLEYSPRFGYDAIFALMELFESDFGEFLYQVAQGLSAMPKLSASFVGDVRLTVPPFPAKSSKDGGGECEGVPIFGLSKAFDPHVHTMEVMLDSDDQFVTSGPHGCVLSVSARGDTPRDAQQTAYDRLDKIHIPNMRYRNDLVEAIGNIYDDVSATGWLERPGQATPVSIFQSLSGRRR